MGDEMDALMNALSETAGENRRPVSVSMGMAEYAALCRDPRFLSPPLMPHGNVRTIHVHMSEVRVLVSRELGENELVVTDIDGRTEKWERCLLPKKKLCRHEECKTVRTVMGS